MYPNSVDIQFNKEYYINNHGQLLKDVLGDAVVSSDVNYGIAGGSPEEAAPYIVIANLIFESMETFQQSFGANAEKIIGDLPNFTNVKPFVQISEIV